MSTPRREDPRSSGTPRMHILRGGCECGPLPLFFDCGLVTALPLLTFTMEISRLSCHRFIDIPVLLSRFTIDTVMAKALFCPTCRDVVLIDNENFPFCSDRCRLLDLGKWASGGYKVSTPIQDPDLLEELSRSQRDNPDHKDEE